MNRKNILIFFGVLGIGLIFYKLLLGLFLPIALFVALVKVLKFLLKGTDSDYVREVSQITNSKNSISSINNTVDINPDKEDKPDQPVSIA